MLAGHLEGKVRALKKRKADYDEARRLSDGGDSCWSDPDGDSDNESAPELDIGPPALEGAEVVGAEVVGEGMVTLQHQDRPATKHRKRVQREEQAGGIEPRGGEARVVQARQEERRGGRGRGGHHRSRQVGSGNWRGSAPALVAPSQWLAVMQWVQWSLRCGCKDRQAERCGLE